MSLRRDFIKIPLAAALGAALPGMAQQPAAVRAGRSERDVAAEAGVAPSYAHRASKHGGLTARVLREARRSSLRR